MSETLIQSLRSLRDVDGVVGSFVFHRDGSMRARDLPAYFDDQTLAEIGPRIERLYEAWLASGTELEATTLVFAEHKLHLRALESGFIGVISTLAVSAPTLKMAVGMVGKKIASELAQTVAASPPSAATKATGDGQQTRVEATHTPGGKPAKTPWLFRGLRLP